MLASSERPCPRRESRRLAPEHPEPCARAEGAVCSRRACRAVAPATSVPPCPRRASGAPAVVAAPEPSVPRLRRGRVPASAPASGVRVVDVPASREPSCSSSGSRRRVPEPSVRPRPSSERGGRVPASIEPCARVARAAFPRPRRGSRRASVERAAVQTPRCARDEGAVCSRRASRRDRRPCAALWRPRRECRRARAQSAAAVCLRRGSRRARAEGAAWCASVERAAVPPSRERYAGAVGAVSEWWTCLRRACRTDR